VPWSAPAQRRVACCQKQFRATVTKGRMEMSDEADPLVQYIVVRRDLLQEPYNWPMGALIAQGAHAAVAAIWRYRHQNAFVGQYCEEASGTQMRTLVLEAPNERTLQEVAQRLASNQIEHVTWIEHPEAVCTALATAPGPRSRLRPYFPKLRLFR
jgi:peptidyl-tRNA hydrolase